MYTITKDTIGEAHEAVVRLIMSAEDYNDVLTEDKEYTFEAPEPVNIHIRYPEQHPLSSPSLMFGDLSLDDYCRQMQNPRMLVDREGLPDFSYLYSNLIKDYPSGVPFPVMYKGRLARIDWPHGNGRGNGKDQIRGVIDKLLKAPTSRRCVVTLFEPYGHPMMDDPPCLNHIQFLLRNNCLNMHALFRSNDMLSAWGGNAYALMNLQRAVLGDLNIAGGTDYKMGWLETTSVSAHVYCKRDSQELDQFKNWWH